MTYLRLDILVRNPMRMHKLESLPQLLHNLPCGDLVDDAGTGEIAAPGVLHPQRRTKRPLDALAEHRLRREHQVTVSKSPKTPAPSPRNAPTLGCEK